MNIGFEAKRFFTNFTGLGNYSRFIVDAIAKYGGENFIYLFTPQKSNHPDVQHVINSKRIHVIQPGSFWRATGTTSIWRSWYQGKHKLMADLDVYHGLSHELPPGLPDHLLKVVTVHDLIFYRYPEFYSRADVMIYKKKLEYACRVADRIVAISNQTKNDLISFLDIDPNKICVVYQGIHPIFKSKHSHEEINQVKKKYQLPDQYILQVGTIESRKNALLLLKAIANLSTTERIPVVLLGRVTAYRDQLDHFITKNKLSQWVYFLHDVPFSEFPRIYQGATIFVYPSLFEGFGIPLVEAIESGVPVITSTGSCFREAAGPASIYVDPADDRELSRQLQNLLGHAQLRETMVQSSREYIQQFNPEIIARELLAVYNKSKVL